MSKLASPQLIKRAITLRIAGHTLSSIVEKTGLSASTLYRYFKKFDIERGSLTVESVAEARESLLNDALFIDNLKLTIASSIADDLALSRQIRDAIALSLEELIVDNKTHATLKSRSLAALSTSLKITQDVQRKALNVDRAEQFNQLEELPTLTITRMTDEEIQAAQNRFIDEDEEESVTTD
jgi:AcrR family transcriptional regulator